MIEASAKKQLVFICGNPSNEMDFEIWNQAVKKECLICGEEEPDSFEKLVQPAEFEIEIHNTLEELHDFSGLSGLEKRSRGKGRKIKPWQKSKFNQ